LGREEREVLEPAVEALLAEGNAAARPVPAHSAAGHILKIIDIG
jgi:4-hydroxy-L-threonine phosphate dehydrogenase PdxA